jgi:hypothetical protein
MDTQEERTGLTGGHLLDPSQRHDLCMKHASCGLQNHEGSHPQRDSLAACLGGNITFPSSWTAWSSTRARLSRVVAARSVEWGTLSDEVPTVLEMAHPLVEPPSFQVVADAGEFFVFSFDLGDDGASVGLELGSSLVMAVVALDFSGGGEVQRADHCSQGEKGGSIGLQELFTPVWHGVNVSR